MSMIVYTPELDRSETEFNSPEDMQTVLGIMTLMDILNFNELDENIGEYGERRQEYINNHAVKIIFNDDFCPVGYAAWIVKSTCIELEEKVIPSIGMLKFLRILSADFGQNQCVYSICNDSARERQLAW